MLHTDMAIIDSMVAARQEQVATTMWESHQRSALVTGFGSLLVRVGLWLAKDPASTAETTTATPPRKRPQLA